MTTDELAMECKRKEIACLKEAKGKCTITVHGHSEDHRRWYFDGKASAYADIWELATYGRRLPPDEYNEANEYWSKRVEE